MNLKEAIETVAFELGELPCVSDEAYDALDYIENNADNIVEVVRCKDCKHTYSYKSTNGDVMCCEYDNMQTPDDCFCPYGERKNDAKTR